MTILRRAALGALLLAPLALATPARAADITVEGPWARAAVQGGTGGVFLTLRNAGAQPDRLLSAASPVARAAELHETVRDGEVMRMRPVTAIEVPAGGTVTLRPGSLHLMLVRLSQALRQGTTVPVTLNFERGGSLTVQAEVRAAGAGGGMPHGDHGHGGHGG
ncbi:copper chaperone PCu(A)C [Roseomonas sp. NAR14]|uniref:Copper chaperone PCu(A)C n=1 Tax=Roseomonas acroporae TaxID=2937791 RepID=A0A9X1Y5I9_9PROT|nr:copper chaperone PCu(A)C [Roseomonas acroporae]MCK8783445.1 copper chaperone PCu(A)C [Roseomonas acroporae]